MCRFCAKRLPQSLECSCTTVDKYIRVCSILCLEVGINGLITLRRLVGGGIVCEQGAGCYLVGPNPNEGHCLYPTWLVSGGCEWRGLSNLSFNFFGEMQMKSRVPTSQAGHVTEKFIQRDGPSWRRACKVPLEFIFFQVTDFVDFMAA